MNPNKIATQVFKTESEQILCLIENLTQDFESSVDLIRNTSGKVVVLGMGKSGIVGKKIAATLASTGTPSFFVHPGDAYHGDLGMIGENDIILLISYSGETDELLKLITFFKDHDYKTISMTGNPRSTLALNTLYHLNVFVEVEACPLHLAPTSSTTASMVMGDALAIALIEANGFKERNFAEFHPGGSLGRGLTQTVGNVMKKNELPLISEYDSTKKIIQVITSGKCGLVVIEDSDRRILGVISDGDLRRTMEKDENNFFKLTAKDLMTRNPKNIHLDAKLGEAKKMMIENKISSLLVVNDAFSLEGIVQMFDLDI